MIVRHVKFPCGRRGLELETWSAAINGNDGDVTYSYYYNGFSYPSYETKKEFEPAFDIYGRMKGLGVIRIVGLSSILTAASSDWM